MADNRHDQVEGSDGACTITMRIGGPDEEYTLQMDGRPTLRAFVAGVQLLLTAATQMLERSGADPELIATTPAAIANAAIRRMSSAPTTTRFLTADGEEVLFG